MITNFLSLTAMGFIPARKGLNVDNTIIEGYLQVMDHLTNAKSNIVVNLVLAFMIALSVVGCASQDAAVSAGSDSRQINDIIINENSDSLILSIRGNRKLTHTEESSANSKEIVLFFPATGIDGVKGRFVPPHNDIISFILAGERVENETTNSTIYITLKTETPYGVTSDTDGLQVTFPQKKPAPPDKKKPHKKPAENEPEPRSAQQSVPAATVLRTVTTDSIANAVAVNVKADGTIINYKAFTLVNPDRIVFDFYNIKSPYQKEHKIAVQSKWIKQIRYYGHPTKIRLVIETLNNTVSKYSSAPTDTGLMIHVGAK